MVEADRSLQKTLKSLTIPLSEDSEKREVNFFTHQSALGAVTQDGDIKLNKNYEDVIGLEDEDDLLVFALMVDTLSHELEHKMVTDEETISEFKEEYDEKRPRIAAFIRNIVEDGYVDNRRTDRDRGLKPVLSKKYDLIREDCKPVTEYEPPEKHVQAIYQTIKTGEPGSAATPIGYEDSSDEFKQFCAEAGVLTEKIVNTYIESERTDIAHELMDLIEDYAGSLDAPDLEFPDIMVQIPIGSEGDTDPLPDPGDRQEEEDDSSEDDDLMFNVGGEEPENETVCPNCGSEDISSDTEMIDGMDVARGSPPVSPDSEGVDSVQFVIDESRGVCGHKVVFNSDEQAVKMKSLENIGYKVVSLESNVVEVLEKIDNYDDMEESTVLSCNECDKQWHPDLDI